MKKILYISAFALLSLATSCTDMLEEKMKTQVTVDYLYSTPDGLSRVVTGLYNYSRTLATDNQSDLFAVQMMDYSTDLMVFRAGSAAAFARLDNLKSDIGQAQAFWTYNYNLIGKANEVIAAAEKLGIDNDPVTKKAWAEAKLFRGRSYFELFKRYDRLYLNTSPTDYNNLDREFTPATKEDVFQLINEDLTDAMNVLDWTVPSSSAGTSYGRFTKAVAKHIKAQVAMWQENWDEAISQCEDIFACPSYAMLNDRSAVFSGADLNSSEVLWSFQFSNAIGGGGFIPDGETDLTGHRLSLICTPNYKKVAGLGNFRSEHGGYGWGRVYPNTYLFSLYNQEKDTRYKAYFKHEWVYLDEAILPKGKKLGDVATTTATLYLECLHPCTRKYFDMWSNADLPSRKSSFKDIVIYRLAETYLMAAEAYFHKEGGTSAKAIAYYNETWERAGNDRFAGSLTLDILLDEYARELNFEGVRWPLLKRLGLLEERVKLHAGDTKLEDTRLDKNFIEARNNFKFYHWYWPIPQSEIDQMGKENFPQNDGY